MKNVKIRDLVIGTGMPKICVSITSMFFDEIVKEAEYIQQNLSDVVDLIEFRVDYFQDVFKQEKMQELLKCVRGAIKDIPLIFTFRTFKEGGEKEISLIEYEQLLSCAILSGDIDLVDIEIMFDTTVYNNILKLAKDNNVKVIASNHDFKQTPAKDEIVSMLMKMDNSGADIPKIAVMPRDREDVLVLLQASSIAKTCIDKPFVTISMGKIGAVSRMSGEIFGSCITFATAKKVSAPGQIDVTLLNKILKVLHS